ncbi:hypothetical protein SJAG_05404 [Schizosaccharomyces japonicus yFS275]|uniref:Uncharacterized protein n=1 Tax=Schizosaccharomyces japonicus (strain yFS275 / FY16936) TaxID=402676 RepID=T0TB64_SCHJY|nr:hypothetical protein SJAG_05404 [Schizosaccharomyces japonicus yFS275]EQC53073.1 hypothetical protein SJAG_05404 [Schizosaccharomyces japonicus yFS275]
MTSSHSVHSSIGNQSYFGEISISFRGRKKNKGMWLLGLLRNVIALIVIRPLGTEVCDFVLSQLPMVYRYLCGTDTNACVEQKRVACGKPCEGVSAAPNASSYYTQVGQVSYSSTTFN